MDLTDSWQLMLQQSFNHSMRLTDHEMDYDEEAGSDEAATGVDRGHDNTHKPHHWFLSTALSDCVPQNLPPALQAPDEAHQGGHCSPNPYYSQSHTSGALLISDVRVVEFFEKVFEGVTRSKGLTPQNSQLEAFCDLLSPKENELNYIKARCPPLTIDGRRTAISTQCYKDFGPMPQAWILQCTGLCYIILPQSVNQQNLHWVGGSSMIHTRIPPQ